MPHITATDAKFGSRLLRTTVVSEDGGPPNARRIRSNRVAQSRQQLARKRGRIITRLGLISTGRRRRYASQQREARKGTKTMSLTAALRDLNKLNAFVRVAERRSFTKAAADLRTTPSVVSKHMKELEDALGFSLLNRSTHGIVLTDAGEGLFQNCLQMLATLDDYVVEDPQSADRARMERSASRRPSDYARCVLAPLILEFARRHPGLRIHLFAATDNSNSVDDGFDVIVASTKPSLPGLVDRDLGGDRARRLRVAGVFPALRSAQKAARPSRAQLSRQPVFRAQGLAVSSGLAAVPRRGEGHVLVEQLGRSDPDGAAGRRDRQGSALCGGAELANKTLEAIFEGATSVAGTDVRLFFEGQASAGEDHRLRSISCRPRSQGAVRAPALHRRLGS